ncbi:MAG: hypothetical protein R3C01_04945 [Planctomycetaceae bacterium]
MAKASDKDVAAREAASTGELLEGLSLRGLCIAMILVAFGLSFIRLLEVEKPIASANDSSRWCTIWALTEEGTYQIDHAEKALELKTIDKALLKSVRVDRETGEEIEEEHIYSTKPPLFPTMVAVVYRIQKGILGWRVDDSASKREAVAGVLLFVNFLPWGIALWMLYGILNRLNVSPLVLLVIMATACFGTLLSPFLLSLNNHLPAAVCLIVTLAFAMRITIDDEDDWKWYTLAGFFAGLTVTFELPAAAFGVGIFAILVMHDRARTLKFFVPVSLIPLIAFIICNIVATGTWKPVYLTYGSETYNYVYKGVPSYWSSPRGIDQAKDSPLVYLFHCTVGHHGILSLSPIFLLTLLGWGISLIRIREKLWPYMAMGASLTVIVLGFFLTRVENYNYGGNSVALRWMLWLVPFWLIALIPALELVLQRKWLRVGVVALLAGSMFSAWFPWNGPWTSPWLYSLMERRGWIDYSDPEPQFERPVHSWLFQIPEGELDPDYWVELESIDGEGLASRMRIVDGGRTLVGQRLGRLVYFYRWGPRDASPASYSMTIDVDAFNQGRPIEEFIIWSPGTTEVDVNRITRLLSGLPRVKDDNGVPQHSPFFAMKTDYARIPGHEDAVEVLPATVQLQLPSDPQQPNAIQMTFVAEMKLSREVPFGVLTTQTSISKGSVRRMERWTFTAAGKFLPRHTEKAAAPPVESPATVPPASPNVPASAPSATRPDPRMWR